VIQICQRVAVLEGGTIVECLRVDELEAAQNPSTRGLLGALPAPVGVLLAHRAEKNN